MSLSTTLIDLVKGCPRNIKRRLLRDIMLILFVTSGALLVIFLIEGIKTRHDISTTLINDSKRLVEKRFKSFAEPMNSTMQLLAKWGESSLFNIQNQELLARQFQALMEIQPNIKSISLADMEANKVSLSHHDKLWHLHEYRGGRNISANWINGRLIPLEESVDKSHPPSQTQWFRGAMTTIPARTIFLTEPYIQDKTEEIGITASLHWSLREKPESDFVSAVSFSLIDLMLFVEQLELTENSHILLLQKKGRLLSDIRNSNRSSSGVADKSRPVISEKLFIAVTKKLKESTPGNDQVFSVKVDGKIWWLGFTSFLDPSNDVWTAVLIPENDIFSNLRRQWLRFGIMAGSILLVGILMTIFLVRKYSHQLKDLPQQHINSLGYENEISALIQAGESTTLEFKSTMRTNLKSGKTGKEIELAWLKAVTGFMNSDGGILLIGVADDGSILGIDADNFANEDKCQLHFKNLLNTHIGAEFTRFIHLKVVTIQEKTILIIECERVRRPVFLSVGKNEDFFIRSGPSSTKLSMSQMIKYLGER